MRNEVYSSNRLKMTVSVDLQRGCKMSSAEPKVFNIYNCGGKARFAEFG